VYYVLIVAVVYTLKYLLENMACLEFTEKFFLYDHVEEFASFAQFGDQVNVLGIFEIFIELEDIRMVQLLENFYFLFEPLSVLDL
jgi:hypothetical protein